MGKKPEHEVVLKTDHAAMTCREGNCAGDIGFIRSASEID